MKKNKNKNKKQKKNKNKTKTKKKQKQKKQKNSTLAFKEWYVVCTNQIVWGMYLAPIRRRIKVCISHQSDRRLCSLV